MPVLIESFFNNFPSYILDLCAVNFQKTGFFHNRINDLVEKARFFKRLMPTFTISFGKFLKSD